MADHRQHQHPSPSTCRRGKKKRDAEDEALGRSRGGSSTKIHIGADALGNPVGFLLSGGEVADVTQAEAMIKAHRAEAYIADKA